MIALDTTAIIDLFKGNDKVKDQLKKIKEPLCTTRFSYLELMFGINPKIRSHVEEEGYYDEFFNTIKLFEMDSESCKKASRIYWDLKHRGLSIEQADCIIAGILNENGIKKIITRNKKHFQRIPGISVIEY